jgi:thiaminase
MADHSSITEYLLRHPETKGIYMSATQNSFLALAGQGKLQKKSLSLWLSQDRLYAQAYLRFIGGLVSRVHLPIRSEQPTADTLEWRIFAMLHGAQGAIMEEMQLFETTAKAYGLGLNTSDDEAEGKEFGPNEITERYLKLFDSFTPEASLSQPRSLLEGLTVLWATEKAYLEAWTYAKQQDSGEGCRADDNDGGALRTELIPNWTSVQFREFVKDIGECLDLLAARSRGDEAKQVVLNAWREVMALEQGFWPPVY